MPHNYVDSHAHHIFPPSRSNVPRSSGGFLNYPKATRTPSNDMLPALPSMEHSSTSLLMEDIYDERTLTKLSRFASFANSTGAGVSKDPAFAGNSTSVNYSVHYSVNWVHRA